MQVGDVVLLPKVSDGVVYAGVIDSDYSYASAPDGECPYTHRRKVRWMKALDLTLFSNELRNSAGSILTLFSVSNYAEEFERLLTGAVVPHVVAEGAQEFALESHLEEFLVKNWYATSLAKNYVIVEEGSVTTGQQYVTQVGRIDILARSKDGEEWLVIELKKGRSNDEVVGQVLRYIGWIGEHEAQKGETVRGLIVTKDRDEKLMYALKTLTNVDHMTYSVNFNLHKE